LIADDYLFSTGSGKNILSGTSTIGDGWILKVSTDYIIKLTNQADSTTSYNANFAWHEPLYMLT
jgi:hypothetical protein